MNLRKIFPAKLDKIVTDRYETRKDFVTDYDKSFPDSKGSSIESATKRWFAGSALPSSEKICNLSKLLKCDTDYLLTEQEEYKKVIQHAAETTGLSYKTIDELTELPISEKHIVDAIFSRTNVSINLIKTIKEMLYYSHPATKNQTYIKLDKGLTARDEDYEDLEHELNKNTVIDILSYKLSFEMHKIIEALSEDDKLSNEIKQDYKGKFFKKHQTILAIDELPKLITDDKGNLIIDTDEEIYKIEEKILNRLEKRDKKGKNLDYGLDNLNNYSDFCKIIREYRMKKTKEDYLSWLKFIDDETE